MSWEGEHGGRDASFWVRDDIMCHDAKQSQKREGGGLAFLRLALGDPRNLLVLKVLTGGPRGWDHQNWRLRYKGALCDLPGQAGGVHSQFPLAPRP